MVGEDDRLVGGEHRVEAAVVEAVRVLPGRHQPHQVEDVDDPHRNLRQVPAQHSAIWHIECFGSMDNRKVLLQNLRDHHRSAGQTDGSSLSQAQHGRGDAAPFLPLPIQSLYGHESFLSQQPRQEGKQRGPQRVIMHKIVASDERMRRA